MEKASSRLRLRRRGRASACAPSLVLGALLAAASPPAAAAAIDDVRAAVGTPLKSADPSAIAGAVRQTIEALPPQDLEQAIDLVGAVAEEVEGREAVAEIAGAAQSAIDTVAQENPDVVEGWWASIIKESVLTVVEGELAAAEQAAAATGPAPAADAHPLSGADLPLVTERELGDPEASAGEPALAAQPPAPKPKPVARAEPAPRPEPASEPELEPEVAAETDPEPAPTRRISVEPVTRTADRAPTRLAPPPRTLDQQLADRLAEGGGQPGRTPLAEQIMSAAELLRSQGRPITTEALNQAMVELSGDCAPLDLEALRAAARYGRCRDELTRRLAGVTTASGRMADQTATVPPLDEREAFREMVRGYASGNLRR